MGNCVLVRMTTSAQLVDITLEQQRLAASVRLMTGITVEVFPMGLIATLLTALGTSWVMAGQTHGLDLRLEKCISLAAVGIVAG